MFGRDSLVHLGRFGGRDRLRALTESSLKTLKSYSFTVPMEVDLEYDLTLRNDISTLGNIQWYYFKVTAPRFNSRTHERVKYPLSVRFQIVNLEKGDSLYNYGMRPVCYKTSEREKGWHNTGRDVCYFSNSRQTLKKSRNSSSGEIISKLRLQYSLVYTYTFTGPDEGMSLPVLIISVSLLLAWQS